MTLRPYQREGVQFLKANRFAWLGDEMGLGKTPTALLALVSVMEEGDQALIVCPANLRINWQRECETWTFFSSFVVSDLWGKADLVIVSYNSLKKWHDQIRAITWKAVVCDEAHYMKTLDSQRTIQVRGGFGVKPIPTKRKYALTGTPMPNRPIELYPVLKWLEAPFARTYAAFGGEYCGGVNAGYLGATKLDDLREKIKTVMLRRRKADVLKELPAKTRQVLELEADAAGLIALDEEKKLLAKSGLTYEDAIARVASGKSFGDPGQIARIRHQTGLAKVGAAQDIIAEAVDEVGKVIVFAHHRQVLESLAEALKLRGAVTLMGGMNGKDKQAAVDLFQNDSSTLIFFGNIQAAGVGITLTASSHVIFVEMDWVPGVNVQAEDRAHRMGQRNNVTVQYLVLSGSLDAMIARAVVRKQAIIDTVMN